MIFFSVLSACFSQDVITKKSGEDIQGKVLEVNQNDIKFKKADNPNGPTFSVSKSEILIIRYENGTKDIFNETKDIFDEPKDASTGKINFKLSTTEELFKKGQEDATKNYNGYKGAGTGTVITTLVVGPILGLAPAILCSSSAPKEENLNYPSSEKMKNFDYSKGYTQNAYKIKKKKVWKNYWIGLAFNVAALVILAEGR